jgi:hypothetical protein
MSFVGREAGLPNVQAALKHIAVAARMADCGQRVSELHRRLLGAVTVEKLT